MEDTLQINGLEPIIAPDPVSFWPPAPGWYFVAAIMLLLLLYGFYLLFKKYQKNQYRRLALQELNALKVYIDSEAAVRSIALLNALMKRTALEGYPRKSVAALSGKDWLTFLKETYSKVNFNEKPGSLLANAGFEKIKEEELKAKDWQELLDICKLWIIHHRT
jgi:uncharacterized protein DUF4381